VWAALDRSLPKAAAREGRLYGPTFWLLRRLVEIAVEHCLNCGGELAVLLHAACVADLKEKLGAIPTFHAPDLFGANSFVGRRVRTIVDCSCSSKRLSDQIVFCG
jgi:hypothetical protein